VIQQASGKFREATRLALPPGSSGHGPVGSPRLSIRTRRAALGVQVISEDDFRRHPGGLDRITCLVLIMQEPLTPDQHAISALPRVHPPRAVLMAPRLQPLRAA
jgi:hypothetical protein